MQEFNIDRWLKSYIERVKNAFPSRIEFIGIQGSYVRNEATEKSDIDVVLLLDKFTYNDLKIYEKTEWNEQSCT